MTRDEAVKMLKTISRTVYLGNRKFIEALDCAIEALERPEPCEDAVSRKAVKKILSDEFDGWPSEDEIAQWERLNRQVNELPSVTQKLPECEDAVSREKVLQCIKESRYGINWGHSEDEDAFLHLTGALYLKIASKECLPSVTPERERGKWAVIGGVIRYGCPICHYAEEKKTNFCPNCGADMRGD